MICYFLELPFHKSCHENVTPILMKMHKIRDKANFERDMDLINLISSEVNLDKFKEISRAKDEDEKTNIVEGIVADLSIFGVLYKDDIDLIEDYNQYLNLKDTKKLESEDAATLRRLHDKLRGPLLKAKDAEKVVKIIIKRFATELQRYENFIEEDFRKKQFTDLIRHYALCFTEHLGKGEAGLEYLKKLEMKTTNNKKIMLT